MFSNTWFFIGRYYYESVKDRSVKIKALQCLACGGVCWCFSAVVLVSTSATGPANSSIRTISRPPTGAARQGRCLHITCSITSAPAFLSCWFAGLYFAIAKIADAEVDQPILRCAGLVLVTTAASTTFYCFTPHGIFSFPMGSGGVLGVAAAQFLRSHFASLGTAILARHHLGGGDDSAGRPDCFGGFWLAWFYHSQGLGLRRRMADRAGAFEGARPDLASIEYQAEKQPQAATAAGLIQNRPRSPRFAVEAGSPIPRASRQPRTHRLLLSPARCS